jgi:hypothetical protein
VSTTREGSRWGRSSRRRLSLAIALGAALIAVTALPGTASATSVDCIGKLRINKEVAGYDYEFFCTQKVNAYSIVASKPVEYFSTEASVFAGPIGAEAAVGQRYSCEGGIPDWGFGCFPGSGQTGASPFYTVQGSFSTSQTKPCSLRRHERFRTWLVVTVDAFTSSGSKFPASSEPIPLFVKCNGGGAAGRKSSSKH